MENPENQSVIAFDTLYTTNHIQILKILLPFVEAAAQKKLIVMIKFLELQYTLHYISYFPPPGPMAACGRSKNAPGAGLDIVQIFEQIKNFCTPGERAMFEQLSNMKKSMEMYEEMTEMMRMFSELNSEKEDAANPNPMDLLKGMLSPEQQAMFEMFQNSE